ncbi:hypothetical protein Hanom_Chr04g00347711 [Helianthus anomalus]
MIFVTEVVSIRIQVVDLLSRVQRVMHSNVWPRDLDLLPVFAIQKGVAGQLVARLPTISM